jgi:hypothetical protein
LGFLRGLLIERLQDIKKSEDKLGIFERIKTLKNTYRAKKVRKNR